MNIFTLLLACIWIVWSLYWQLSNVKAKQSRQNSNSLLAKWWMGVGVWIAIVVVVLVFSYVPALRFVFSIHTNSYISSIGIFIIILGQSLTVWARVYLGTSWGVPMTRYKKTELVTNGPYTFIRHPIYLGMIIAMFGTMLVIPIFWIIPFVCLSTFLVYCIKIEEKDMLKQFPKEYGEYKKQTKALIPFIY